MTFSGEHSPFSIYVNTLLIPFLWVWAKHLLSTFTLVDYSIFSTWEWLPINRGIWKFVINFDSQNDVKRSGRPLKGVQFSYEKSNQNKKICIQFGQLMAINMQICIIFHIFRLYLAIKNKKWSVFTFYIPFSMLKKS